MVIAIFYFRIARGLRGSTTWKEANCPTSNERVTGPAAPVGETEAPRTSPGRVVGAAFLEIGAAFAVVAACNFDRAGVLVAIDAQVIGAKWNWRELSGRGAKPPLP